jgi:hypothetical protein
MISTCPNCRKQVAIPAGVDSAAEVRCPLCDAEYVLGEALALAPPELIPVRFEENEAAAVARQLPASSVAAQLRRRPSKPILRTVIEVVLGGLAGCLVAYYGLALCFGSNFDKYLPKLPLPFISRLTAPPAGDNHPAEKSLLRQDEPHNSP